MHTSILHLLDWLSCSRHIHTKSCHPYVLDYVLQFSTSMVIHHWAICLTSWVQRTLKIKQWAHKGLIWNWTTTLILSCNGLLTMLIMITKTHPGNNTVHMLGITGTVTPGVRTYHYWKKTYKWRWEPLNKEDQFSNWSNICILTDPA